MGKKTGLECFKVLVWFGREVERLTSVDFQSNVGVKNVRVNY